MTYCPLDLVENYLRRFVVYPSDHAIAAHTLWIAHTHFMDGWDSTPRLAFMSPLPRSGKTRALEVTEPFVPYPLMGFSISAAVMTRSIGAGHDNGEIPTILYDEIDNVFSRAEEGISELRAALNAGYRRGAKSCRCLNAGAVLEFNCFAPLVMAGLKDLPDALATRTIFIHMRRRAFDEPREPFRPRDHLPEAAPIKAALVAWCQHHQKAVTTIRPELPPGIEDRDADIWEPLIAVADIAGGDWPNRARAAAVHCVAAAADSIATSSDIELFAHIQEAFKQAQKIHLTELVRRLRDREDSPWNDLKGKPLTTSMLRERLKPYGIKATQKKISGVNLNGSSRTDFHDSWKRLLVPPISTASTASTTSTTSTNLMNKNKKVEVVEQVELVEPEYTGNGLQIPEPDDLPEPGSFEP